MARGSRSAVRIDLGQADTLLPATRWPVPSPDQAAGLRHLLEARSLPRVRVLAVTGAERCGKSAIVAALARHAGTTERVLVLDQSANEVARHAGLRLQHDLFDLVSGRRECGEAVACAGNWRLLAGRRGLRQLQAAGASLDQVFGGFLRWRDPVSLVLLNLDENEDDARNRSTDADLLLVTTPGNDALTKAYARIKQLAAGWPLATPRQSGPHQDCQRRAAPASVRQGSVRILINGAASYADARRVFRALADTARNFLEIDLAYAGFLPPDRTALPFGCRGLAATPACEAALARLASGLAGWRLTQYGQAELTPPASIRAGRGATGTQHDAVRQVKCPSAPSLVHFEQGV